jgi:hypothetical protein
MTRRRPRNRVETECRKFKVIDPLTKTAIKLYVHVDRENHGDHLGPPVAIRLQMRHAKGSLMDGVLAQVSDHLSAEVQTTRKEIA